ncbi:hypothetical protein M2281_004389 [Mesorhizobium soli]|nr:hypothetical protein [Mesorhizobium soli]
MRLLPVTKTVPAHVLRLAYAAGISDFGENKLQEARDKRAALGDLAIHWSIIGDIPEGATSLATTALCARQGFAIGQNVLGLQFHPEVDACAGIERWLIGHAAELASARIEPSALRADATKHGPALREAAPSGDGLIAVPQWVSPDRCDDNRVLGRLP